MAGLKGGQDNSKREGQQGRHSCCVSGDRTAPSGSMMVGSRQQQARQHKLVGSCLISVQSIHWAMASLSDVGDLVLQTISMLQPTSA
jgi:hypothetical protein